MVDSKDDALSRFIAGLDEEKVRAGPAETPDEPEYLRGLYRKLEIVDAPDADRLQRVGVEEAREIIRKGIGEYLNGPDTGEMLLVQAVAGVGKTTIAVEMAERLAQEGRSRVLYAGPRHDFFVDLMAIAKEPDLWYEWQPRKPETEKEPGNCQHFAEMAVWLAKGYKALDFCKGVCGYDYMGRFCPYLAQREI